MRATTETSLALSLPDAQAPAVPLPEKLADEPSRWHARLCSFCLCGPARTVDGVWRDEARATGGHRGQRPPGSWRRAVARWNWEARAAVYDAGVIQHEAETLATRRRLERNRRRDFAAKLLSGVEHLLDTGFLREVPASVALAATRAVQIHREEFGSDPTEEQEIEGAALGFLAPADAAQPVVKIFLTGPVERDELPPEGEVAEETDGA